MKMKKITKSGFAAIDETIVYVSMTYENRTEIFKLQDRSLRLQLAARMISIIEAEKKAKRKK